MIKKKPMKNINDLKKTRSPSPPKQNMNSRKGGMSNRGNNSRPQDRQMMHILKVEIQGEHMRKQFEVGKLFREKKVSHYTIVISETSIPVERKILESLKIGFFLAKALGNRAIVGRQRTKDTDRSQNNKYFELYFK
ncbi:hypothetical protein SNE40_021238 [Patella caerulea]|uniref:Uncharacterized protein n=1 Tax=Patella caerulea TaxID=87958 RepID=A0AAN8G797_PATCE